MRHKVAKGRAEPQCSTKASPRLLLWMNNKLKFFSELNLIFFWKKNTHTHTHTHIKFCTLRWLGAISLGLLNHGFTHSAQQCDPRESATGTKEQRRRCVQVFFILRTHLSAWWSPLCLLSELFLSLALRPQTAAALIKVTSSSCLVHSTASSKCNEAVSARSVLAVMWPLWLKCCQSVT